ncbi:MAG: hypothetical protein ACT4P0_07620 [Panacagrimonas sp.]
MCTPTARRLTLLIAIFGWLAQLCLPMAHATLMADGNTGLSAWCGAGSPAMKARLAALPPDVREILQKDVGGSDPSCVQLCSAAAGGGLPPIGATVALRAAGVEIVPVAAVVPPQRSHAGPPPARGPPALR